MGLGQPHACLQFRADAGGMLQGQPARPLDSPLQKQHLQHALVGAQHGCKMLPCICPDGESSWMMQLYIPYPHIRGNASTTS